MPDTTFEIQPGPPGPGTCRGCGARVLWVLTAAGRRTPLDHYQPERQPDGRLLVRSDTTHWSTCPYSAGFGKRSPGRRG